MNEFNTQWIQSTILFFLMGISLSSWSQSDDHSMHQDHSAHLKMMSNTHFTIKDASYVIPGEILLDEFGKKIELKKILNQKKPIALNFIFTTCTTICPVMTATFAQMRRQLGKESEQVQLVSITIDPEYDRPEVLKKYAENFGASEGWSFLTGDGNSINKVLRSFDVFAGSKMNHQPVTLFKSPKSPTWIRVDGLASGEEMASLVKKRLLN
jgi:protein SCO1/2